MQMLVRFLVGGAIVSLFAALGDMLRPKSFAGIFGAAPSVALATITLTIISEGSGYAATEARSMAIGAVALFGYTWFASRLLWRAAASVRVVTLAGLLWWLTLAVVGRVVLLGSHA